MVPKDFTVLRERTHRQSRDEMLQRFNPTLEELALGSFLEEIEVGVREAVRALNRMGYETWSSGFHGYKHDIQGIDGPFFLSKHTTQKLIDLGVRVCVEKTDDEELSSIACYSHLDFNVDFPGVDAITNKWKNVIDCIPDKGYRAPLSRNYAGYWFRKMFLSDEEVTFFRNELRLRAYPYSRWVRLWKDKNESIRKMASVDGAVNCKLLDEITAFCDPANR